MLGKNRKNVMGVVFMILTLLLPKSSVQGRSDEVRNIKKEIAVENYNPFLPPTIHSLSSKFLSNSKVLVTQFLQTPLAIDIDQYLSPYRIGSVIMSSGFLSSDLTYLTHRNSLQDFPAYMSKDFPLIYYYKGAGEGSLAYDLKFRLWGDDNVTLLFNANNIDNDWMEGQLAPFYLNDVQLSMSLRFWLE